MKFFLATLASLLLPAFTFAAGAVPPDGAGATKALVDSPRHGEWVDVKLGENDAPVHTWVSYPERKDKAPVVIVIHEIFGMTDWVRGVADQLAADGFIALAPDLLSGKGPNGGGTESFTGDAVRGAIQKLTPDEVVLKLDAVRAYALALPAASDKTASIGFCWGGSSSFNYAAAQPKLNAAVVYYGTAPKEFAALEKIACPVAGFYGGDDARVTATVAPTTDAMTAAQKSYTPHVFDGAGHGFLRQQAERDGKNKAAAEKAWEETVGFLKGELEKK